MYFHLVYSPKDFGDASGRKLMHRVFCEATELVVTIDHEFVGISTSPPYTSLSCPFHIGMGKCLKRVNWALECVMG